MGLDITAYSNLNYFGAHVKERERNEDVPGGPYDWCYYEGHVFAFAYIDFPRSFRGIPLLTTRRGGQVDLLVGGCYAHTEKTGTHCFQAGSYMGYNHWREDLKQQFNPELDPDGPFYELIWFADNEGMIGPEAAGDLLVDFQNHAGRYSPSGDADTVAYYWNKYDDWTRACGLAANGGLIHFH